VENNRNLIPAHREKAQLHLYRMEFSQAENSFNEILRVDANDLGARAGLAKVLSLLRRPEDALVAANQVLERTPGNADALTARAEALLMSGRYDDAGKDFKKLAEVHPNNPFYLHRLGAVETMKGKYQRRLGLLPASPGSEPQPGGSHQRHDLSLHEGSQAGRGAPKLVDEMAAKSTRQDVLHLFRGKIHLAQDSYADAEKDLRQAIEANPESYEAYMMLGQMNLKQERVDEAIREVEALIAKRPDFAPAFLLKAFYLERKRDSAGAMRNYQKVLELSPDNPIAANNLAWNYCMRGENLETALGLARKARQKDPENAHIADTLGWVYYKMGSYTLAADQLLFAVNKGKPGPENYYRLGMAYYKKGDQLQAKQALRRALEMSQSFTGAAEARAALLEIG
jgi:tetratricopeptide (TPR) repeat protein